MKNSFWIYLSFLIIPTVFFATGLLYLQGSGLFFLKCVDPEYAYLFNGLLIADLKPNIDFVYHPGTPMQCVIAMVIRVIKIFRPGEDLVTDVLRNPEIYLRATIYTVNFLGTLILIILGSFTYKKTGNIFTAMFVQLLPFVHILGLEPLARVVPESLMVSLVSLWVMLFIAIITNPEPEKRMKRYSLIFGILFGLSLADKLTFLPFFLVPLFVLTGLKNKLRFAGISAISFLVFAFPVIFKYRYFTNWVKNIIIHTGSYGSGDLGVVKWPDFMAHLKLQFESTPILILSLIILVITLGFYLGRIGKGGVVRDRIKINLSVAIFLVAALQYIICAKQFSFHYMLPAILLTVPVILLSFSMMNALSPEKISRQLIYITGALFSGLILINIIPRVERQLPQITEIRNAKTDSFMEFKKSHVPGPLIISASYYGCSAVEYALTFGLHESGKYGTYLFNKVRTIYPSTYLYFPWGKVYYEGNKEIMPQVFVKKGIEYDLYIAEYSDQKLDEILKTITSVNNNQYTLNRVYYIPGSAEALFRLKILPD